MTDSSQLGHPVRVTMPPASVPSIDSRVRPAPMPGNAGPVVMTVFGIILAIAGWAAIGIATSTGSVLNGLGGLMFAVIGGLLWVGGRINARINAWARYNASR